MTAPSNLTQYDAKYDAITRLAASTATPYSITSDTPQLAISLRRKLYGYFSALRAFPNDPRSREILPLADGLMLAITGCTLVFHKRGDTPEDRLIQQALELAGSCQQEQPSTTSAQQLLVQKLHDIRMKKLTQ